MSVSKQPDEMADDMRAEYDFSTLKGAVRGRYYKAAMAGSTFAPIEPAKRPRKNGRIRKKTRANV